jgi:5'-methylthioadenosine phosphorylase
VVGHVAFGDPVCPIVSDVFVKACAEVGVVGKKGGTYVCMEGPQFSTRAESNLYRSWGADIIGMTNLQEAKLAREAEISYATLAMVTDYDCWREGHDDVTVEQVIAVMHQNSGNAQKVVKAAVRLMPHRPECQPRADGCEVCDYDRPGVDSGGDEEEARVLYGKYW